MAYSVINASETDADSPVTQTLMDKVKDNFAYLYSLVPIVSTDTDANGGSANPHTVTIDDSIDYRDRLVRVAIVYGQGTAAACASLVPGGAGAWAMSSLAHVNSDANYRPIAVADVNNDQAAEGIFYTKSGGAAYSTASAPRMDVGQSHPSAYYGYLWIDSTTGALKLTYETAANNRAIGWLALIWASADLGGV